MVIMTVIYQTPQDIQFFEQHYYDVHIPLAKKLPGLLRYEVNKNMITSLTQHEVYRIANLYFESQDAIRAAFASEIGQQCAADRRILAPESQDVQIYFYETEEV